MVWFACAHAPWCFEICICIIATVYTAIYGLDVCFNIYQNRDEEDEEEMPEYIKRLYA